MRDWRIWLGLAISAASIFLLLRQVELELVAEHMARARLPLMAALVASVPITLWMKAARWRLFFRPDDAVSVRGLFSAMFIGYMVIVLVPLRAGELVRGFLVSQGGQVSFSRVLATIVVEKVLDVLAVAVMLFALAQVVPLPDWAILAVQGGGLLLLVSIGGLAGLAIFERPMLRLVALLEQRLPVLARLRLGAFLVSFNQGLEFLHSGAALVRVAGWTLAIWVTAAFTIWVALEGMNVAASAASVVMLLGVTNLGMVVPSGPGYVGTYHLAVVETLRVFGVGTSQALGAAIVLHAVTFGTVLLGGLVFLWRGKYGLNSLLRSSRASKEQASDSAEAERRLAVGPLPVSARPLSSSPPVER